MQISLLQLISAALLALAANAEVYLNEQFLDGGEWILNLRVMVDLLVTTVVGDIKMGF